MNENNLPHAERLARLREWYASRAYFGFLKIFAEKAGLRREHLSRIAKGRIGCLPHTLDKIESAMREIDLTPKQ